ncbi:MAG: glycoside hydrolase family 3 N-terminal domain-containing protein [Thermoguttaceae bacterium]|jgi:beta-glucosidase
MNALNRCLGLLFFFATLTFSMGITRLIAADTENSAPGKDVPASNDAAIEAKIDSLLRTMTLDEKIGQMTQVDLSALKDKSDIQKYFIGSVLSGGDSDPPDNSPQTWAKTYDELQAWALKTRLKIPLIYGIDAVHGHNNVLGAVIFPHNIGLGATRNPELVEKAARITALEVSGTGINWTFAPCIAVARNIRWGRTYESFGETPELAESLGAAAVQGFQGKNLADPHSIVACAKHYMGDGGTTNGKDQGNTQCDEATLRKIHLPGYVAAVKAGAGTIMASFSSWNGKKMHGNKYLLTDVLKNELGFKGFLVSDWAGIDQLSPDFKTAIEQSINAGMDMAMVPNGPGGKNNYVEFIGLLKELAAEDKVPQSRIDDAVRRILRVKFKTRLFEQPFTDPSLTASIGSAEHRQAARDCVRQSLVLLKNENHVLPLAKNTKRLLVAGKAADDLGMQCGGWTIMWQGRTGKVTGGGTTILAAIRQAIAPGTEVIFSAVGENAQGTDAAIVVVGESPYAEGNGDRKDLSLAKKDIDLVKKVKQSGVPVITILLSGRPMILGPVLDDSDAFIAAWLPGTEGQGVADVLFGDYKPTGKLPHTWPKSMDQVPLNVGDPGADKALFPYGFGLTY